MRIGIIGAGAIAGYVTKALEARGMAPAAVLLRPARVGPDAPAHHVAAAADVPDGVDVMVDCAGHEALVAHGPTLLARGIDVVTVSLGALADPDVADRLAAAARSGGSRLHLASGAIGALDCLGAARVGGLDMVRYTGRKPPAGWRGSPAETKLDLSALTAGEAVHFEGTAREAALAYPKNANVAAAVALAGAGFEATTVRLIADAGVNENVHEVSAEGAFGRFHFEIRGRALEDNPRSSALAAMSVVATLERQRAPVGF